MDLEMIDNDRVWSIKYFILPFALLMTLISIGISTSDLSSWIFIFIAFLALAYIAFYAFYSATIQIKEDHIILNKFNKQILVPLDDIAHISQFGILEDHHYMVVKLTFTQKTPIGNWVLIHLKKGTPQVDDSYNDEIDFLYSLFKINKVAN